MLSSRRRANSRYCTGSTIARLTSRFRVFFDALAAQGFIEGQNLTVLRYSAEGQAGRFDNVAQEAVTANPHAIFAVNTRMVRAARALSASTPIEAQSSDPVSNGLTDSLAQPSQNITGLVVDAGRNIIEKHLDLFREAVPGVAGWRYLHRRLFGTARRVEFGGRRQTASASIWCLGR